MRIKWTEHGINTEVNKENGNERGAYTQQQKQIVEIPRTCNEKRGLTKSDTEDKMTTEKQ